MIRTTYDPEADVLNVAFGPADAVSDGHAEVAPGVYLESDTSGHPIGIEVTSVNLRERAAVPAKAAE